MGSTSDEGGREIFASVEAIGRIGSRWSEYLMRRERRLVVAKSLVYGGVVFFVLVAAVIAYAVSQYDITGLLAHKGDFVPYFEAAVFTGVATVVASLVVLNRRTEPKLKEVSELVEQLKAGPGGHEEAWKALAATRKMLDILPEIARPKTQDALVYGLLSFVLAAIVARAPIGIAVGLAVFLYFRYEGQKTYQTELSRLEEQRKIFEEKMQSFAQTL